LKGDFVTEEEARQAAAVSLGMSVEGMEWLGGKIAPFRHADVVVINSPIRVYADQDGADMWEVEVTGLMGVNTDGDELGVVFRIRNFIADKEFWRGSCQVPDHFKITLNGETIFDSDVENPDDPDDDAGWERYQLFNAIRLEAWDAATAMLYTGRIEREEIGPS